MIYNGVWRHNDEDEDCRHCSSSQCALEGEGQADTLRDILKKTMPTLPRVLSVFIGSYAENVLAPMLLDEAAFAAERRLAYAVIRAMQNWTTLYKPSRQAIFIIACFGVLSVMPLQRKRSSSCRTSVVRYGAINDLFAAAGKR